MSGSAISSTDTWLGKTFSSLGLNLGTYVYKLPNDTVTINRDRSRARDMGDAGYRVRNGGRGDAVRPAYPTHRFDRLTVRDSGSP